MSPLIRGSLLRHVDSYFATREEIFYARYMDDFIFFTKTRWHLRKAIKRLHEFFDLGGFETHPDKTQLGKIEHGFDWLGIWYAPEGPRIAPRAIENHRAHIARLYEQARMRKLSKAETDLRMREYETRWMSWAKHHLRTWGDCLPDKKFKQTSVAPAGSWVRAPHADPRCAATMDIYLCLNSYALSSYYSPRAQASPRRHTTPGSGRTPRSLAVRA